MESERTSAVRLHSSACARFVAITLALVAVSTIAAANVSGPPPTPPLKILPPWAQAQKPPIKRALVIGINQYQFAAKLTTPSFDAEMVANTLKKLDSNFVVTLVPPSQMSRTGLLDAIAKFVGTIRPGEVVFVYFSGHGLERDGTNYVNIPRQSRGL